MGVQDYLRVVRKRLWVILLTMLAVYGCAMVYTQLQPRIYETRATVEVVQKTTIGGLFEGALLQQGDAMATAAKVIRSTRVMSKVVDLLQTKGALPRVEGDARQLQIAKLQSAVNAVQVDRATILAINVRLDDPELARLIANKVAQVYCSENLSADMEQERATRLHLEEQVRQVNMVLMQAERDLEDFKQTHNLAELSPQERVSVDALVELEAEYRQASALRAENEMALQKMQTAFDPAALETMDIQQLLDDQSVRASYDNLVRANLRMTALLEDYTPRHPAVLEAEEQVAAARQQLASAIRPALAARIETLRKEGTRLREREQLLGAKLGRAQGREMSNLPETRLELARLQRLVDVNNKLYVTFTQRLEEMRIVESAKIGGMRILDEAPAAVQIYPRPGSNAMGGLIIGLVLGLAFAFVIESMDTSIGTIEDVEAYIGKPVLGVVPLIHVDEEKTKRFQQKVVADKADFNSRQAKLVAISDPKSPVTEAYRTLRTNLHFSFLQKQGGKVLLITSATPQEGKTTTITNLAVIFAQAGKKTMVLSCNLRHPGVYKTFGLKKKPGITDVLVGSISWREAVQDPGIDNLSVLAAGPYPPNPAELLDSPEFSNLLAELRQEYDIILVDSPPVLPVTDAAIIGAKADGVLMVYFAGKAAREALLRAKVQLESVHSNIIGVVLNRIQPEGKLGYTYYYHYQYRYYGPKEPTA